MLLLFAFACSVCSGIGQISFAWFSKGCSGFCLSAGRLNHLVVTLGCDAANALCRAACARRNQATHDDVFLEANQLVTLALHRSLGENAGCLLEGRRRYKATSLQAGLSDTKQ